MVKLHKIELYIYGLNNQEDSDFEEFREIVLEGNGKMQSGAVSYYYHLGDVETKDVGEWEDDHPLNHIGNIEYCRKQFEKK